MFRGDDSTRIKSSLTRDEIEAIVEDCLRSLGPVDFDRRDEFRVSADRFETTFAKVEIFGSLRKSKRVDEWVLDVDYTVSPTTTCWVIAILGGLFILMGLLILLVPLQDKSRVQRAVERALRDVRDEAESAGESKVKPGT